MKKAILAALIGCTAAKMPAQAGFVDDWARMKSIAPQGYVCYHATGPVSGPRCASTGRSTTPRWLRSDRRNQIARGPRCALAHPAGCARVGGVRLPGWRAPDSTDDWVRGERSEQRQIG